MTSNDMYKKLQKAKEISIQYELFDLNILILEIEMKKLLNSIFNKSQLLFDEYLSSKEQLTTKNVILNKLNTSLIKVFKLMITKNKKINAEDLSLMQNEF